MRRLKSPQRFLWPLNFGGTNTTHPCTFTWRAYHQAPLLGGWTRFQT
jgi:hypothetical protein